jgi:hypothetical protein
LANAQGITFIDTKIAVCNNKRIRRNKVFKGFAIYSEAGTDMSRWKNAKHFTSWLGLAPNAKISSNKISCHVPKKKQYAGQVFRIAAMSLRNNKGLLGDFYRRICAKAGAAVAIVAIARKLAVIYYYMMTPKQR